MLAKIVKSKNIKFHIVSNYVKQQNNN